VTETARASSATTVHPGRRIALYPALLAVTLIVELVNVSGVSPFSAGRPLILAITLALVLAWLGRLLFGDPDRGGIAAALWVLALLGGDDPRLALAIAIGIGRFAIPQVGAPRARLGPPASRRPEILRTSSPGARRDSRTDWVGFPRMSHDPSPARTARTVRWSPGLGPSRSRRR